MDDISIFLLVVLILVAAVPFWEKYRKYKKIAQAIDCLEGDKWYPVVGTSVVFLKAGRKNFWKEYLNRSAKYGPVFRSWSGLTPVVHLRKPNHIEVVLSSTENIDKGSTYDFAKPWFGNGLLTSKRNKWRVHRKLLTPAFHFSILESFSEIFSHKSQMLADQLLPLANGSYFDIFPYLTHCALDIICETSMGVKINAMEYSDSEYVKAVDGILEKIMERIFIPLYHNNFIYNLTEKGRIHNKYLRILHSFTEKVIRNRQTHLAQAEIEDPHNENLLDHKKKQTFLDLLLKINETNKGYHLTFDDIRDEVSTFIFGGHDTSTVTSCWTLFLIGNYPDVQEKLHQELDDIFHGEENPVTTQDILEMKYLESVIKESLRMYTVVPAITRKLSVEIDIDGHKIPPGVTTILHLYELHRDPEFFPDPTRFNPDRFLSENFRKRHPFAYVPFSAGPRNCIGQKFALRSVKTLLSTLLRRYRVRALKKPHEIECNFDIFLKPQDGMYLSFELRNPSGSSSVNHS